MAGPVERERTAEKRWPWVTCVLLVLCVGVYLKGGFIASDVAKQSGVAIREAARFFIEHPYLRIDARVDRVLGPGNANLRRTNFHAGRERRQAPPIPEETIRRDQEALDALLARDDALHASLPHQSWAVFPARFDPTSLITYSFVHASWVHLAVALLFVYLFGAALESVWGTSLFSLLFAGSAFAAAGLFVVAQPHLDRPLIGLSGPAAGLMGAFLARFSGNRADAVFWLAAITGSIWLSLPFWIGDAHFTPPSARSPSLQFQPGGVYWAHLGGLLFGTVLAFAIRVSRFEEKYVTSRASASRDRRSNPLLHRAIQLRRMGRLAESERLLKRILRESPDDCDAALTLWQVAVKLERGTESAAVLLKLLNDDVWAADSDRVARYWRELVQLAPGFDVEPALIVRIARRLRAGGHLEEASEALRLVLDRLGDRRSSTTALAVIEAAADFDPEITLRAAKLAVFVGDLDPRKNESLWAMIRELELSEPTMDAAKAKRSAAATAAAKPGAPARSPASADLDGAEPPDLEAWDDPGVVEDLTAELSDVGARRRKKPRPSPKSDRASARTSPTDAAPKSPADPPPKSAADPPPKRATRIASIALEKKPAAPPSAAPAPSSPARGIKVVEATPVEIESDALFIQVKGKGKTRLSLARFDALSVAAVHGLGDNPVVLIDLVLNWAEPTADRLKLVRLRGDDFDPRKLIAGVPLPLDALREFINRLLSEADLTPLPDADAVRGRPFARFHDLRAYHRAVLRVDDGARSASASDGH